MDTALDALKMGLARLAATDFHSVAQSAIASATEFGDVEFKEALYKSFGMVACSELGDKTFFIAALMAMRSPRLAVFLGCWGALAGMTVLSAFFGLIAPTILPKSYTHYASIALFCFFGVKMLYEGLTHDPNAENEELKEAEREILGDEAPATAAKKSTPGRPRGRGRAPPPPKRASSKPAAAKAAADGPGFLAVVLKALTLTFVAEWGDRSQLVTMGMAASANVPGVVLGGAAGHFALTSLAVIGGRKFADQVPEHLVQILGGLLFCAFAMHGAMEGAPAAGA